jgi:hypothetical protein
MIKTFKDIVPGNKGIDALLGLKLYGAWFVICLKSKRIVDLNNLWQKK